VLLEVPLIIESTLEKVLPYGIHSGVHSLNMKALIAVLNILFLLQFTTIAYAFSNKTSGSSKSDARIQYLLSVLKPGGILLSRNTNNF
jgi:hypothetical protein